MTSARTTLFITLAIGGALTLAVIGYTWFIALPSVQLTRDAIDADRATKKTIEEQQSNLARVRQELDSYTSTQTDLEKEIWTFANEDAFYELWNSLERQYRLTIPEPTITDATPSNALIARPTTVVLTGRAADVVSAVGALQQHQPLVAITALTVQAQSSDRVEATLEGMTIWK